MQKLKEFLLNLIRAVARAVLKTLKPKKNKE